MHHARYALGALLSQETKRICGGFPGMDNEGLAAVDGCRDMGPEARMLPSEVARLSEVVEPGFSYRHDSGVVCQFEQLGDIRFVYSLLRIRVHTDGPEDMGIAMRNVSHSRERRKIHRNAQDVADSCVTGAV
jgi:hypothetical protein